MSNIKKYIIDYDWKASIEIEIDHDVMTEEKLHQINNFWSDSEYRLNKHGSVLNAVLIMLAQHALLIAISSDLNAYGVVCEFDWNDGNGQEGWPPTEVHVGINGVMQMLGGIGDSKQQAASRQSQKPQQQSSPAQHNEPPMDFDDDIPFAPVTLPFPSHAIHAI
ncbi:DUF2528 family protein [Escherichia coli]